MTPTMQESPRKPLVLIVDDDRDTREMYRMLLEFSGYGVAEAGDVRTAVATAIERHPDVVVTDWNLPGGNGLTLCASLHAESVTQRTPIVPLTGAMLPPDTVANAMALGCVAFLAKPVMPEEMLATIGRAIEQARA